MNSLGSIDFLLEDFAMYNDQTAIIWKDASFSYKNILQRIHKWRDELTDLQSGTIVGLEGDFSPETISLLYALIEKNAIIAPFDINHTEKNRKKYEIAQLDLLIRVQSEENIVFTKMGDGIAKNDLYKDIIENAIPGLVLFTSGSSGEPKAALHNFSK